MSKDNGGIHMVTGAFGYSGKHIAGILLRRGYRVKTLTNALKEGRASRGDVEALPLIFDDPAGLAESLRGVDVLYNTYWTRFGRREFSHEDAVRNTLVLFEAAKAAGVGRIVHTSITNPSVKSPLTYFNGKARLEEALANSGISHAILRPAVFFGEGDILINNIAWLLRRFPVFLLFGDGSYRLQPIHVLDFAELAVQQGQLTTNTVINAIGPETFTYADLVRALSDVLGCKRLLVSAPPQLCHLAGAILSKLMQDVVITRDEIRGLMDGLLYVDDQPAGSRKLTTWARENAKALGARYASELGRRRNGHAAHSSSPGRVLARAKLSMDEHPG